MTKQELREYLRAIRKKYNANFVNLVKYVGKKEHRKYITIERKLNKLEVNTMQKLGIYIAGFCSVPMTCGNCTGLYKVLKPKFNRNRMRTVKTGGIVCKMKHVPTLKRDRFNRSPYAHYIDALTNKGGLA